MRLGCLLYAPRTGNQLEEIKMTGSRISSARQSLSQSFIQISLSACLLVHAGEEHKSVVAMWSQIAVSRETFFITDALFSLFSSVVGHQMLSFTRRCGDDKTPKAGVLMPDALLMPTTGKPVIRTPSFIPSIYPYRITVTLSTSTPSSVLTLPRHQLLVQDASSAGANSRQTATGVLGASVGVEQPCTIMFNKGGAIPNEM